jgi:hypothetical protein
MKIIRPMMTTEGTCYTVLEEHSINFEVKVSKNLYECDLMTEWLPLGSGKTRLEGHVRAEDHATDPIIWVCFISMPGIEGELKEWLLTYETVMIGAQMAGKLGFASAFILRAVPRYPVETRNAIIETRNAISAKRARHSDALSRPSDSQNGSGAA